MIFFVLLCQVILLYFSRKLFPSYVHACTFFSSFLFLVLIASLVFAPDYYFSHDAYFFVLLMQLACLTGAVCSKIVLRDKSLLKNTAQDVLDIRKNLPLFTRIIWSSLAFGAISILDTLARGGVQVGSLFNFDALLQASNEISVARYTEEFRISMVSSICQMFIFFSLLTSAFVFSFGGNYIKRSLIFLPFLPLLVVSIVLTTRATVLFGVVLWVSSYMATSFYTGRNIFYKVDPASITKLVCFILLGGAFFVVLQFFRAGFFDLAAIPEILQHLRKWPFGSIAGFSIWFDNFHDSEIFTGWGYYTFTGMFDLLGLRDRETGLYLDYVDLGSGEFGNIYMALKGLLLDFGFLLTSVIFFLIGYLSTRSAIRLSKGIYLAIPLASAFISFIAWFPIVSFFSYTGHIFSYILFFSLLKYINMREHSR
ncbi:oligosaccharide repeat unit polymerase [Rheinheimera sediminis]|uniref:O-antigen polymerase n=1 Tax=Rheinheimera sp. YQF-1 TaxID=2499626 RepID=UPI000FD7E68E|nr:O-antigen polymerase [Rheinheimera sp. YQF-1]RVT46858.1 oligosaccharide repeat unit polymerase [Rheinheimera sp. YQF-1]